MFRKKLQKIISADFSKEKFKSSSIVGKTSGIATRTHGRVNIPGKRTHSPCLYVYLRQTSGFSFGVSQTITMNISKLKYLYKT